MANPPANPAAAPPAVEAAVYPATRYHKNGRTETVRNDAEARALGPDWSDKPNDNTLRALRKASGAAKTDQQPGVYQPNVTEAY